MFSTYMTHHQLLLLCDIKVFRYGKFSDGKVFEFSKLAAVCKCSDKAGLGKAHTFLLFKVNVQHFANWAVERFEGVAVRLDA